MTIAAPGLVAGRPGVRCSLASAALDEPLAATAPVARVWVALEQPGPYGRKALTESHLDPRVGAAVAAATDGLPVTVVLIRRPGPHADGAGHAGPRRWFVADTTPGRTRLVSGTVDDPAALLDWDWRALADGRLPEGGTDTAGPVLLVCTNGRRDLCCALAGRDLVRDLAAHLDGDALWESSHLGGHRFAPTALVLPWGTVYGRLGADDALAVLAAASRGELASAGLRGRSTWTRAGQAAELAVRRATGEAALDTLTVHPGTDPDPDSGAVSNPGGGASATVRHRDGRAWRVSLQRTLLDPPRPESCGKAAVDVEAWAATSVTPR